MSANILFINEEKLKDRTGISNAIAGDQLFHQIKLAQDMYVQPALGSTFYSRLQTGIDAGNLTNDEKAFLDNYVTDCVVWYTMSLLPLSLSYQFFSKGVLQKTSEESLAPSRADIELLSSKYKEMAEFYKQRIINYLRENYLLFSEYFNPGSGLDVIFPETKAYTCPIYLGGSYVNPETRSYNNSAISGTPIRVEVTPDAGVSFFDVSVLGGRTVMTAVRSGLAKGITASTTTNTAYLQIVGSRVTLPTGDITNGGELFIFTYR